MTLSTTAAAPARRGRRCEVCALDPQLRTAVETALAEGTSYSRIARSSTAAPSRDSLRRHVQHGHLPAELQARAERAQGLDHTTVIARISDIALRHRETALEAREASNHTAAIRAGDAELRALQTLAGMGVESERDADTLVMKSDLARAAFTAAQQHPEVAELIAAELDAAGRTELAAQLIEEVSGNEGTS